MRPCRPSSQLPFSGFPVAAGLIIGFALLGSGALLVFRRRNEFAQQAAALASLRRR